MTRTILEENFRGTTVRLIYLLLIAGFSSAVTASTEPPIRFGLTAVVMTENTRFLDDWSQYLEQKMGREVEFVLRRSYRDVMDLLDSGGIEFAWICGYPYVQTREPESLRLMTVPIYRGSPSYYSYIIVHHRSPHKRFSDLKGKVFAFSDPDSNSGFLYPLSVMMKNGDKPETFFRETFFTFNHAESVQAIAEQVADGGAVDSYIWEYLAAFNPEVTSKTRIIDKSPKFGFPPIVSRLGVAEATVELMKDTLENMNQDATGKALLAKLKLDGFGNYSDSLYNDIRAMANKLQRTSSNLFQVTK
jgi:phosphonate transport system substrate-binding protein